MCLYFGQVESLLAHPDKFLSYEIGYYIFFAKVRKKIENTKVIICFFKKRLFLEDMKIKMLSILIVQIFFVSLQHKTLCV